MKSYRKTERLALSQPDLTAQESRFHSDRVARGDRHHRRAGRFTVAGRATSPRSRPAQLVQEQPEATRLWRSITSTTPTASFLQESEPLGDKSWTWDILPYLEQTAVYEIMPDDPVER